jgi:hypothetical protein
LIDDAFKRHVAADSAADFVEARFIAGIAGSRKLICLAAEAVDVESDRVSNATPRGIYRDPFSETRNNGVVCDRGEGDQIGTWTRDSRRLRRHCPFSETGFQETILKHEERMKVGDGDEDEDEEDQDQVGKKTGRGEMLLFQETRDYTMLEE